MPEPAPEPERPRRGAVIFDRDGVLNLDVAYAHRPDQIVWVEGAAEAVRAVNDAGLWAFVATNQSGVARGYYSEAEVETLHAWMAAELLRAGARIDAWTFCPHHVEGTVARYAVPCERRKPGPGMLLDLLRRHDADPTLSLMVGDQDSDLQAAAAAGTAALRYEGGSLVKLLRPHLPALTRESSLLRSNGEGNRPRVRPQAGPRTGSAVEGPRR